MLTRAGWVALSKLARGLEAEALAARDVPRALRVGGVGEQQIADAAREAVHLLVACVVGWGKRARG